MKYRLRSPSRPQPAEKELPKSDPRRPLDQLGKYFNRHDLDGLARSFAQHAVLVAPDGVGQDREEIASYYGLFMEAFPDSMCTPQSVTMSRDTVVAEYTLTGTHSGPYLLPGGEFVEATRRPITVRACSVSIVEDGVIVSHRIFYDQLELVAQLGGSVMFRDDEA
ncbi:ester cyclase [Actinomadura sp. HBU206391]|uniref:ester cyclase n=1 Tax=Actinomadura sp. HBU206391 TaxID=2731692 RepID=UPI00164FCF0B|nr:ester cyclase [Actinomadura sp. HBU206391]MBC6463792.1 ester cyclase [Actinomadura sp. HBU206391]